MWQKWLKEFVEMGYLKAAEIINKKKRNLICYGIAKYE